MNVEHFMREQEMLFENQHGLTNQIPLAGKPGNQQHKPSQEDTTSNTHQTNPHHKPEQDPQDGHKKSKLERIDELYNFYRNVRQENKERAIDFIKRFQNAHSNLAKEGASIPPYLLTFDLLEKSNLDQRAIRTALASCDTEKCGGPYLRALKLLKESNLEEEGISRSSANNSTRESGQEVYEGIQSYLRLMDALQSQPSWPK